MKKGRLLLTGFLPAVVAALIGCAQNRDILNANMLNMDVMQRENHVDKTQEKSGAFTAQEGQKQEEITPPSGSVLQAPQPPSAPQQENRGVVNPRTGEYLVPSGSGVYSPRTGDYYVPSGSGYYNPKTGEFVPKRQ